MEDIENLFNLKGGSIKDWFMKTDREVQRSVKKSPRWLRIIVGILIFIILIICNLPCLESYV